MGEPSPDEQKVIYCAYGEIANATRGVEPGVRMQPPETSDDGPRREDGRAP